MDKINPEHYKVGGMEVIDILQAKLTPEQFEGFLLGNVFKYAFRYRHKNGTEDLQKSQWYLNKLIGLGQSIFDAKIDWENVMLEIDNRTKAYMSDYPDNSSDT